MASIRLLKDQLRTLLSDNIFDFTARVSESQLHDDHLEAFADRVEADLRRVIDRELEARATEAHWDEGTLHASFGTKQAGGSYGRISERKQIADYAYDVLRPDGTVGSQPFLLQGEGGAGKTTLMAMTSDDVSRNSKAVTIRRFIGATPDSLDPTSLIQGICVEIAQAFAAPEPADIRNVREVAEAFQRHLALATPEQPLMVWVDSIDQLATGSTAEAVNWLPAHLPSHVALVVSVRAGRVAHAAAARIGESHRGLVLGPMAPSDGAAVLDGWLRTAQRQLTPEQRDAVLTSFHANGLPLQLRLAFEESRLWRSFDLVPPLPDNLHDIIRRMFDRLVDPRRHGPLFVSRAMAYLQTSRAGLTEAELQRALAEDAAVVQEFHERARQPWYHPGLPPILWARLFAELEPYLSEDRVNGALVMRFFHLEIADAAAEFFLPAEFRRIAHHHLAAVFAMPSSELRLADLEAGHERAARSVSERPYHLISAGEVGLAVALLSDIGFLMQKCAANLSDSLVGDFQLLLREAGGLTDDVRAWFRFIRRFAHLLRRGRRSWPASRILLQLAAEAPEDTIFARSAENWLGLEQCTWGWLRSLHRGVHDMELGSVVLEGGHGKITLASVLATNRILQWFEIGLVRLWDSETLTILAEVTAVKEIERNDANLRLRLIDGTTQVWEIETGVIASVLVGDDVKWWQVERSLRLNALGAEGFWEEGRGYPLVWDTPSGDWHAEAHLPWGGRLKAKWDSYAKLLQLEILNEASERPISYLTTNLHYFVPPHTFEWWGSSSVTAIDALPDRRIVVRRSCDVHIWAPETNGLLYLESARDSISDERELGQYLTTSQRSHYRVLPGDRMVVFGDATEFRVFDISDRATHCYDREPPVGRPANDAEAFMRNLVPLAMPKHKAGYLAHPVGGRVKVLETRPDGVAVAGCYNGETWVQHLGAGAPGRKLGTFSQPVEGVELGDVVLAWDAQGEMRLWDDLRMTGRPDRPLRKTYPAYISPLRNGAEVVAHVRYSGTAQLAVWSTETGEISRRSGGVNPIPQSLSSWCGDEKSDELTASEQFLYIAGPNVMVPMTRRFTWHLTTLAQLRLEELDGHVAGPAGWTMRDADNILWWRGYSGGAWQPDDDMLSGGVRCRLALPEVVSAEDWRVVEWHAEEPHHPAGVLRDGRMILSGPELIILIVYDGSRPRWLAPQRVNAPLPEPHVNTIAPLPDVLDHQPEDVADPRKLDPAASRIAARGLLDILRRIVRAIWR
jgi:hypothetical protein